MPKERLKNFDRFINMDVLTHMSLKRKNDEMYFGAMDHDHNPVGIGWGYYYFF